MVFRVGVDIGGTFTDFVAVDENNQVHTVKVLSTPQSPGDEVIEGIRSLKELYGIHPEKIGYLTHGTTVGVNSIIQRRGAKVALIVTQGFPDVLELGRLRLPDINDMFSLRPPALVSRELVYEIEERILADGTIQIPLNTEDVIRAGAEAIKAGAESIVIGFLHSYNNPRHEHEAARLLEKYFATNSIIPSSRVWPVIREYERIQTAVLNAYVQPKMSSYINLLQKRLSEMGIGAELQISKSNGGVMRAELAKKMPIEGLLSGTAAGVIGASYVAGLAGLENVIGLDIGGTSADVALIRNGEVQYSVGEAVGEYSLFTPSVAVSSIGGGGGSIAWLDEHGVLKSGPESAGSHPGPAAYGQKGAPPTTTDAYVVCGFLGQQEIGYGHVSIDRAAAAAAIGGLADKVGVSVEEMAQAIIDVAVSGMLVEVSKFVARYGADTSELTILAFGGAGPMMACHIARECGIGHILVPPTPGVLSALGGLIADTKNNFITTLFGEMEESILPRMRDECEKLKESALRWYQIEQKRHDTPTIRYSADLRYIGQSFEIEVPLEEKWISSGQIDNIKNAFHGSYEQVYGYCDREADVQIVNLQVVVSGENRKPSVAPEKAEKYAPVAENNVNIYCDGRLYEASVYSRETLKTGATIAGPAVVTQADTTTCILPGYEALIDEYRNLRISRGM